MRSKKWSLGPQGGSLKKRICFSILPRVFWGFRPFFFGNFRENQASPPGPRDHFGPPECPSPRVAKAASNQAAGDNISEKVDFWAVQACFQKQGGAKNAFFRFFRKKWSLAPGDFRKFARFSQFSENFRKLPRKQAFFLRKSAIFGYFRGFFGKFRVRPNPVRRRPQNFGKFSGNFGSGGGARWTPFGTRLGPVWDPFGTRWTLFGVRLGSVQGPIWGPSRGPFGVRLGPDWDPVWGPIWTMFSIVGGPYGYVCQTIIIGLFDSIPFHIQRCTCVYY